MSIKDYFFYHKKKFITVILFIIILVGGFFLYKVYAKELNYSKEIEKKVERKEKIVKKKEEKEEKTENKEEYVVDIKGEVLHPGIYSASKNDRVIDIIKKAGGLKSTADTYYLNLSQKVTDQMVIRVHSRYEVNLTKQLELKEKEKRLEIKNKKEEIVEKKKVSINNASKEELKTVSYITENIANLIIERRSKNPFKNIEEKINNREIKDVTEYIALSENGEKIFLIDKYNKRVSFGGYRLLEDEKGKNYYNYLKDKIKGMYKPRVNVHFVKNIKIADKIYFLFATVEYEIGSSREPDTLHNGILTRMWIKENV